jgi:hypothetical protein
MMLLYNTAKTRVSMNTCIMPYIVCTHYLSSIAIHRDTCLSTQSAETVAMINLRLFTVGISCSALMKALALVCGH